MPIKIYNEGSIMDVYILDTPLGYPKFYNLLEEYLNNGKNSM